MTRYAIAPPQGRSTIYRQATNLEAGCSNEGVPNCSGVSGINRRRWRDRPATMRTSCLRGFRKRKITAWSLKHLRRGAVVDSDEMAYFWAAAKAGYEVPRHGPGR